MWVYPQAVLSLLFIGTTMINLASSKAVAHIAINQVIQNAASAKRPPKVIQQLSSATPTTVLGAISSTQTTASTPTTTAATTQTTAPTTTPAATTQSTTAARICFYDMMDYQGGDLLMRSGVKTPSECAALCKTVPGANAWLYLYVYSNINYYKCHCKDTTNSTQKTLPSQHKIFGAFLNESVCFWDEYHYSGPSLLNTAAYEHPSQCASACNAVSGANAWEFVFFRDNAVVNQCYCVDTTRNTYKATDPDSFRSISGFTNYKVPALLVGQD